jgi:hypothetical protein
MTMGQNGVVAPDPRITYLDDVRASAWIAPRLHEFGLDTGSVVPEGFDSYCRIFHPLRDRSGVTVKELGRSRSRK